MGWCQYLLNEKYKLAITISRNVNIDIGDSLNDFDELLKYLYSDLSKLDLNVIQYILDKSVYLDKEQMEVLALMDKGFNKLIHEDDLPKGYTIIEK